MDSIVFEYFKRLLESKNIILKLRHSNLVLCPETEEDYGTIGFRCHAKAKSGSLLDGKIEVRANFILPEGAFDTDLEVQDIKLNLMIDELEFIKTTDYLEPRNTGSLNTKKPKR